MQPAAREGLTAAQVAEVIRSGFATVDVKVDVLDADLNLQGTVGVKPQGSQVTYTAGQQVPFRCTLVLAEQLDWATVRLSPSMILTTGDVEVTVRLGVFRPSLPERTTEFQPPMWQVDGYDVTVDLSRPHGETVELDQGDSYLTLARDVLEARGQQVQFSATGDEKLATRDRIWPIDRSTVTLDIANDVLGESGYGPVWAGWDGLIRSRPDRDPADRGSEWTYDTSDPSTTVGALLRLSDEQPPNRLIGISSEVTAFDPVAGDGVHVVEDTDSVSNEGVRPEVETFDAVDQEELEARTERRFTKLQRRTRTVQFDTLPNPLHWHDDVIRLRASELGVDRKVSVTSWTLPLDGSLMQVEGELL